MPTVTLTSVWLHDAADNSDYVLLGHNAETAALSVQGERRQYAGGRLRSITRPGTTQDVAVSCPGLTASTVADLEERVGVLQMLRDTKGRVIWGVFYALEVTEIMGVSRSAASFTFEQVTYSNEV